MNYKITKVVLVRNPENNRYSSKTLISDDELLILEEYFDSAVGYNPMQASTTKKLIERGLIGCEPIDADIIDGKVQLSHLYVHNLKEPRLTKEELLALVDTWFELVAAKAEKIVITNDNGKFSIGTE